MASSKTELTPEEKNIFIYTNERKYEEVKHLLTVEKVSVNCVDADGMTPLQHAAYKGDYKLCKLFIDCGADVNLTRHSSQYSPLMFAGLSGKVDVVTLLLENGASPSSLNSINKTASQMAAFVGNHNAVCAINNYIQQEEIQYFTKLNGLEKEPKLPLHLCQVVHKMAIMTNIHPVRLIMFLQKKISVLENIKNVVTVFNILCKKKFNEEGNELLSLKFHHLAFVLTYCEKFQTEQKSKNAESDRDILNMLIKNWLRCDKNGSQEMLEKFLRQDIKEYPFLTNTLFQQLVRNITSSTTGNVAAISILNDMINHQLSSEEVSMCATCGEIHADKKCSVCKAVYYCDKNCQKLHWFVHKSFCSKMALACENSESKTKEGIESKPKETKDESNKGACGNESQ